jgi:hypothetical protein
MTHTPSSLMNLPTQPLKLLDLPWVSLASLPFASLPFAQLSLASKNILPTFEFKFKSKKYSPHPNKQSQAAQSKHSQNFPLTILMNLQPVAKTRKSHI